MSEKWITAFSLVIGVLVVYLALSIRIANENERFAVFVLGRFAGYKGPGLVLKMPGGTRAAPISPEL